MWQFAENLMNLRKQVEDENNSFYAIITNFTQLPGCRRLLLTSTPAHNALRGRMTNTSSEVKARVLYTLNWKPFLNNNKNSEDKTVTAELSRFLTIFVTHATKSTALSWSQVQSYSRK
jgi:hypothetical protein